jgi:hypothetical protein
MTAEERQQLYEQAYQAASAELTEVSTAFDALRKRRAGLRIVVRGLGILTDRIDVKFEDDAQDRSFAELTPKAK